MRRKQALTQTQQRAVERLAKGQGCTCLDCGSADYLESDTNVVQSFGGMMRSPLYCDLTRTLNTAEGVLATRPIFPTLVGPTTTPSALKYQARAIPRHDAGPGETTPPH